MDLHGPAGPLCKCPPTYLPAVLAGLKDLPHRNWKHGALVRKREPAPIHARASLTRRSKL